MTDNERKSIELPTNITVRDLAITLGVSPIQVIKVLMANGVMANINQSIDFDTSAVVSSELGFDAKLKSIEDIVEPEFGEIPLWRKLIADENDKNLENRPPVVTILGHVDHGKTTLLDAIRNSNVADGEAGGITQHIGAYQIEHKGRLITFLDTPGHAAFTAMRARGAQGADIVVLVVAADDGVMPQTKEAIAHAKAARVPIIVALNKIDRPNANPDFVKQQLADAGLVSDEWDGTTIVVPVSAKLRKGLEDLLEAILLVADNTEIKANINGKVIGTVIEAQIDRSHGVTATLLVQNGTLEKGSVIVAGNASGAIRAMFDHRGKPIQKALPSAPVLVTGLDEVPGAGDLFQVYTSEKEARAVVQERKISIQEKQGVSAPKATLEDIFARIQAGEMKELRLIIKADVQGSLEPIVNSLNELSNGEIKINILHAETGNIVESDVMLAAASKAIVIGFNTQDDAAARRLAESEGVSIRQYNIIYRLTEDIEKALKGMLAPEFKEIPIGQAVVQKIFHISKVGNIAGCKVLKGEIHRNAKVRIMRNGQLVTDTEVSSLKHEKEDVKEVRTGFEFGISLRNFNDLNEGDILDCYKIEKMGAPEA